MNRSHLTRVLTVAALHAVRCGWAARFGWCITALCAAGPDHLFGACYAWAATAAEKAGALADDEHTVALHFVDPQACELVNPETLPASAQPAVFVARMVTAAANADVDGAYGVFAAAGLQDPTPSPDKCDRLFTLALVAALSDQYPPKVFGAHNHGGDLN